MAPGSVPWMTMQALPEICQKRCLALPHTTLCCRSPPSPLSCDVVVRREVPHRFVWWPRSLHTAEATGSKPVTPTSTNAPPSSHLHPRCQQICQQITVSGEASHVWAGLEH